MSSRNALLAGGCLMLAGCNTVHKNIGMDDPYFGEAARYNAAVQIINPDPIYPENGAEPGSSGARAAAAVERYRTDKVNSRHQAEVGAASAGSLSTTQGTGGGPR